MVWVLLGLAAGLLLCYWSYVRAQKCELVRRVNKIPGPPIIPIFGNALSLIGDPTDIFDWIVTEVASFGPIVRCWLFGEPFICIQGAREAEHILKSINHINRSRNYEFFHSWFGQSIFTANGERWYKFRKTLNPIMSFRMLQNYLPVITRNSITMTNLLADEAESSNVFDIEKYTASCSFDIICESTMGIKMNAQIKKNESYVKASAGAFNLVMERYFSPWLRFDLIWRFSSTKRQLDKYINYVHQFANKVIRERKEYLKTWMDSENSYTDDTQDTDVGAKRRSVVLLDLLLNSEESKLMNDKDVMNNLNSFIAGGFDTVASSMAFTLFLIGTYPDIQDRVVEELVEVFGDSGRVPDVADLGNLKYLECCFRESLRLYPSIPFIERAIEQDVHLDHYVIPAGCNCAINIFNLHRDPEFFPEPEKFNPDRFLPENTQGRHPYAYIPFSAGPRNCIGMKFGIMEQKVVLSTVLRRFRIEAAQTRDGIRLKSGSVLRPVGGLKMRLFERVSHPKLQIST